MLKTRKGLPSYRYKDQITASLRKHQALIICGETGCGKSTQLGQFILEDLVASGMGSQCNIICTQPRRISAISLAERVAAERADKVGNQIGYSIRGESKQSSATKLLFCTTGVLLRMIQDDTELRRVSHVIIDEVHERGVESDFLLVLLKDVLPRRPDLKVVLMSATIDATTISRYMDCCPVIEIPGRTFPVTEFYLEDVLSETGHVPENTAAIKPRKMEADDAGEGAGSEYSQVFNKATNLPPGLRVKLTHVERDPAFQIDYGLIAACVRQICEGDEDGAILIFLPGVMEIKKAIARIRSDAGQFAQSLEIFPLHSMLTSSEQSAVFRKMPPGKRKLVVSTNIAETSVTIDDVVFCIDTGRVKEMKLINGVLSLTEVWASRAACKQRKGRAGRVRPGKAFKLYSSYFEQKYMKAQSEPEILRLPLEQLCLQIKAMGILDVPDFLGKALSPPPLSNIQDAVDLLENVNALGKDGRLTPLGRHISLLPTDVRVGKMLV
ncbi:ATP-dependent DNA/RNA helicase dhx36, partial [Kappamyces sp. JEL0680]